ncbi:ImmA/IrrE family metallo-endopeptidase [Yaniella flava]|uniref:ImmA/IrrE family metallo-endopeptidase n=1 Tax=Yaniella flava TaxID=287930 RepID=A0ABN2TXM1_9MICC
MTLPNYAVGPSEYIEEWLEEKDLNQAELARRMGVSRKHVSKLMSGAPLTVESARQLEYVTGIPVKFWMAMETQYRSDLQRIQEAEELERYDIPISKKVLTELRARGHISATQRAGEKGFLAQQLMRFFGVGSWGAFLSVLNLDHRVSVAYRQTMKSDASAVAVWLQTGELELRSAEPIGAYSEQQLQELIPELRALTVHPPEHFGSELVEKLNSVGVRLLYVKDFPGTGTYGATRWIGGNPVIQLSLRKKGDDIFWFTLFHEIGHVLLHSNKGVFVNFMGPHPPLQEQQADEFAMDALLPPEFAAQLYSGISLRDVDRIADSAGVAPGIVVGRCHHETYLAHSVGRDKIRSLEISTRDDGVGA